MIPPTNFPNMSAKKTTMVEISIEIVNLCIETAIYQKVTKLLVFNEHFPQRMEVKGFSILSYGRLRTENADCEGIICMYFSAYRAVLNEQFVKF